MRKKSHISLAKHLVRSIDMEVLVEHEKAFCIGSILPDCKPSFLTTKHEFDETFQELKEKIDKLITDSELFQNNARAFCRRLGEIIHYIADYFTFPHNNHYKGNLKEHCKYEKYLKWQLKDYILYEVPKESSNSFAFLDSERLFHYITQMHEEYKNKRGSLEEDCRYIVNLCQIVANGILSLLSKTIREEKSLCEDYIVAV